MKITSSLLTRIFFLIGASCCLFTAAHAQIRIVAIGDSSIRGKGVSESEAYPAQLERALRAKGHNVVVANEGINGDTTYGVLARLDSSVPQGTHIAILAAGPNDIILQGRSPEATRANNIEIMRRLRARGIAVYFMHPGLGDNGMQVGINNRADLHVESAPTPGKTEWHLNAAGYAIVVRRTLTPIETIVKRVEKVVGR